jgi:hypothetical protein
MYTVTPFLAHIGKIRDIVRVLLRKLRERDYLEDPDMDGRIILRWGCEDRD